MVIIEVSSRVHSEKRDAALEAMRVMGRATREEPGCLHYRFYQDLEDENSFFVYERWIDGASLEAHMATPHMVEFRKVLADVLAEASVVFRYDMDKGNE
ncbi:MAG: putative quinol monooxygenase [Armatimonas sp.]